MDYKNNTMANKVQLIKEEIEKRKQEIWPKNTGEMRVVDTPKPLVQGWLNALDWVLNIINFLPEEHNEDLEEEIQRAYYDKSLYDADNLDRQDFNNIAHHFAEWQKQKDEQESKVLFEKSSGDCPKELIDIIDKEFGIDGRDENGNTLNSLEDWQCGMILNGPAISGLVKLGVEWQKQQMIKDAVLETKVIMDCDGDGIETPYEEWLTLEDTEIPYIPDNLGLEEGDKVKIVVLKN